MSERERGESTTLVPRKVILYLLPSVRGKGSNYIPSYKRRALGCGLRSKEKYFATIVLWREPSFIFPREPVRYSCATQKQSATFVPEGALFTALLTKESTVVTLFNILYKLRRCILYLLADFTTTNDNFKTPCLNVL